MKRSDLMSHDQAEPTMAKYSPFVVILLLCAFTVNLWAITRHWNFNLRDGHEFRQYQTAISAFYVKKDGIKLAYETPLLGPPWSIPMEFPTYQIVTGKISRWTGYPLEQTGRAVGILFLYAGLPALWLLLRRRLQDPNVASIAVAFALLSPVLIFYTRTFMIESTALCFGLWFLLSFERAFEKITIRWLIAAWLVGSLAALTKITTFAPICTAALFMTIAALKKDWGSRNTNRWRAIGKSSLRAILIVAVPLIAAAWWIVYSDQIKAPQPYGDLLTSNALRSFNLGTFTQRIAPDWWKTIGAISLERVVSAITVIIALGGLFFAAKNYRRLAGLSLVCYFAGPLFFANLYYVHDYYFYASALFLTSAIAILCAAFLRNPRLPRWASLSLVGIALFFQARAYQKTYYPFSLIINEPLPIESGVLKLITPEDQPIAAFGLDWSSQLAYGSERRAIMVFNHLAHRDDLFERSLSEIGKKPVSALIIASPFRESADFVFRHASRLGMAPKPIFHTKDMDVYLRTDLAEAALVKLRTRTDWGVDIDYNFSSREDIHDLTTLKWSEQLGMTSPRPYQSKGNFLPGLVMLGTTNVISTQAPTEIWFIPPAGSRTIEAITGMIPGSYTAQDKTDGVTIVVFEEQPNGFRKTLWQRILDPAKSSADRGDVQITYEQASPFTGKIIFAHYASSTENLAYDWSYWKRITIR